MRPQPGRRTYRRAAADQGADVRGKQVEHIAPDDSAMEWTAKHEEFEPVSTSEPIESPNQGCQLAKPRATLTTTCEECARLMAVKEEARSKRDHSTVTDCNVLLKRHPDHRALTPPQQPKASMPPTISL